MAGIGSIQDVLNTTQTSKVGQTPKSEMGKDQFLQLLVGQLQNQDPMNPMEDKDFMGQMAQFSQLEQVTNMNTSLESQKAFGMLGKDVTYNDPKTGEIKTGTVEKVALEGSKSTLTISGVSKIEISQVTEVR
jgi:flagellar basal-body rod modification protein FlgD